MKHGIFTFGNSAKESYDRMIQLVNRAQLYINQCRLRKTLPTLTQKLSPPYRPAPILSKISAILTRLGFPSVLHWDPSSEVLAFLSRPDAQALSQRGPVTPDHIIRTKRVPLFFKITSEDRFETDFTQALEAYHQAYQAYFKTHVVSATQPLTMLDPFPRVILIPQLGAITVGKTRKDARITDDILGHTLKVIQDAEMVGQYEALPEKDLFDVEYWILEQAKLKKTKAADEFSGKTVVITGGSSGIGQALCERYAQHQTQVFNLDIQKPQTPSPATHLQTNIADQVSVQAAFEKIICNTGKIDVVIINAGIFPESQSIEELHLEVWQKSLDINLNGAFFTAQAAAQWLGQNPAGGQIIFVASKNVPAPGKKAAAYSVMKTAQTQLARVLALESASKNIRVNIVHPNMVFDTGIWTDEVIQKRAQAYGMSPEDYRKNNLLRTELKASDVAEAIVAITSKAFSKTTGAQIPIDGGNERII